jgi:membrane associated rhomboid family serine protease
MLMLIPVHKKVDWKRPPVITLLLILINILVFVIVQRGDERRMADAIAYYQSSGLAKLELEPARRFAEQSGDIELMQYLNHVDVSKSSEWVLALQFNTPFMRALNSNEVIGWASPVYGEWQEKRRQFNQRFESVVFVHYGFRTAEPSLVTLFSQMFLHADWGHLLGNMVFLFAVGLLVEATLHWRAFLITYLLGGLGAAGFDFFFRADSLVPGIGASGAIAGLMGAYTVLYGLKKIRFFYVLGVFFDYISLPAIILLPLWVLAQLVEMAMEKGSNVNFMAHVGGLICGALIALAVRYGTNSFSMEQIEKEERREQGDADLELVRELVAEFKPDSALPILRRLYGDQPGNREVLTLYYQCSRINPASDEYHRLAHTIFTLGERDVATDRLVLETFNEYLRLAKPATRMTGPLVCQLANRFIRQKAIPQAERLVRFILAKKLACQDSRTLVLGFIRLLEEQGRTAEVTSYRKLLPAAEGG